MPLVSDTPTTFTIVDPMGTRHDPKVTESAGVVVGRPDNGYFTTHREEVAQEIQERYPHMLVTRHETSHAGRPTRTITMTVPLTLQEMHERYLKYLEAQKGAPTPQEDTPHVSEHPTQ
jgi:hypothetical protein